MEDSAYFQSLTQEIQALKNRVRYFIQDRHWLSDGLWKESVLRSVLRRHLPKTLEVGTGFIVTAEGVSSQIDILIYDTSKPILFQDGDFVVVTPDLVRAIIEVKTTMRRSDLGMALQKLGTNHFLAASTALCHPFVGLFAYEAGDVGHGDLLDALDTEAAGVTRRSVHCVSLGDDLFTRFWDCPPENPNHPNELWRAYRLPGSAPAYFVHNVIESLCQRSVLDNDTVWYPRDGKERYTLGEKPRTKA